MREYVKPKESIGGNEENSVRLFLKQLSYKHDIPIERIVIGFLNQNESYLYVWDYDNGRMKDDEFKTIEIIDLREIKHIKN